MIEALKKLDKKFLIIAICIILLPILLIIFLALIQSCGNSKMSYEKYQEKMISSFEKYINAKGDIPTLEGEYVKVDLDKLVKAGYINSPSKSLDDEACTGYVSVRRNGASVESNKGGTLNYLVNLECKNYKTVHVVDKLKEEIVTDESSDAGLYLVNNSYVFKGSNPKNYISFYGNTYRVVSIDENNILKLVKTEPELSKKLWDNKYNISINHNYGINTYKDSAILSYLLSDYSNSKKISKSARAHIVAYNACIGKRDSKDYSIDKAKDCKEVLENQVISLFSVSDYALASLDKNCNSVVAKSCNNYNYLYNSASTTWTTTAVSDNSYQVFFMAAGLAQVLEANKYSEYNIVIYVDGNELYTSGSGTQADPYIIK